MSIRMAMTTVARPVLGLAWAGLCLGLAAGWLAAGEPLKFSTSEKKVEPSRGANPLDKYLDRPFESLRPGNSLSPVIPPTALLPNRRPELPEKNERDKSKWENSWIWASPRTAEKPPTAADVFKVERRGVDGRPLKEPTLMDEYNQQRELRKQSSQGEKDQQTRDAFLRELETGRRPNEGAGSRAEASAFSRGDAQGTGQPERNPWRAGFDQEKGNAGGNQWSSDGRRDALSTDLSLADFFQENRASLKQDKLREERNDSFRRLLENRNSTDMQSAPARDTLGGGASSITDGRPNAAAGGFGSRELYTRESQSRSFNPSANAQLSRPGSGLSDPRAASGLRPPSTPPAGGAPGGPADLTRQRERPSVIAVPKRNF